MQKPSVPYNKRKTDPQIRAWSGLNRTEGAYDGEVIDCRRVHTGAYPALQTAAGRTRVGEWEHATDYYETDGHEIVIDENKLYFDGEFKTNVGNAQKQFVEIGRKLVVWPEKIYINLNTGEVMNMEASISGRTGIIGGNVIQITDTRGVDSLTLNDAKTYDSGLSVGERDKTNYFMRLYTNLIYRNGWQYDSVRTELPVVTGNQEGTSLDLSGGSKYFFIGSKPEVKTSAWATDWKMDGTVYGKLTKITLVKYKDIEYTEGGYIHSYRTWSYKYDFELYSAEGIDLTRLFESGDAVQIEGSSLLVNNKQGVALTEVNTNNLVVPSGAMVSSASYFDPASDIQPGTYSIGSDSFSVERKIRVGEQIYKTGSEIFVYNPDAEQSWALPGAGSGTSLGSWKPYNAATPQTLTISRKVPDMDFICENGNRIFGVTNSETERIYNPVTGQTETVTSRVLHASELGYPTRWNSYNGNANDSYAVAVAGEGDFTGITAYSGAVLAFKESRMFKLTGSYPAEFYLRGYHVDGVKAGCHKSMVIINEVLYYLSPYGVMAYTGGVPGLISYNLGLEQYENARAGRDKTDYWISMGCARYGTMIYRYDTVRELWTIETAEQADSFERVGDHVYACIDGKIWKLADPNSEETISWEAVLPASDEGTFDKKRYGEMKVLADVQGSMSIFGRVNDNEDWTAIGTVSVPGKKIHRFNLEAFRSDRIQFKFTGTGKATVWAMERSFTLGSDR